MKPNKIILLVIACMFSFQFANAQSEIKKETVKVSGNCGTCKKNIEKSALAAGATEANWNKKTKFLTISYDPSVTNPIKVETAIAASGYDTQDVKADDKAYSNLDECCQYERVPLSTNMKKKDAK